MRTSIFAFGVMMVLLGLWGKYLEPVVPPEAPVVYTDPSSSSAADCAKSSPYEPKDICR